MQTILLIGAGKSAGALIAYLENLALNKVCKVIIADANEAALKQKTTNFPHLQLLLLDITNNNERKGAISKASVVISLLPPKLHYIVALDCIHFKKHLLTASYLDENIKQHDKAIEDANVLFLYEMGLDPGIDHMSAMQLINNIKENDGIIHSFTSHCGGLTALESDTNPWHYKISWNPRNIVLAGKAGAHFLKNGKEAYLSYDALFCNSPLTTINNETPYAYYPNRDSMAYRALYELNSTTTFIRTTLRHPDFCKGWNAIVQLGLTNELETFTSKSFTFEDFLLRHLQLYNLQTTYNNLIEDSTVKTQLQYLFTKDCLLPDAQYTPADALQFIIENKLQLMPNDKDMIIMKHEIEYTHMKRKKLITSTLIVKGDNNVDTAMAKTVGLPLGITANLLITNNLECRGLKIPIEREIYEKVLYSLKEHDIKFKEDTLFL